MQESKRVKLGNTPEMWENMQGKSDCRQEMLGCRQAMLDCRPEMLESKQEMLENMLEK